MGASFWVFTSCAALEDQGLILNVRDNTVEGTVRLILSHLISLFLRVPRIKTRSRNAVTNRDQSVPWWAHSKNIQIQGIAERVFQTASWVEQVLGHPPLCRKVVPNETVPRRCRIMCNTSAQLNSCASALPFTALLRPRPSLHKRNLWDAQS